VATLLHHVGRHWADVNDGKALAAVELSWTDLAGGQSATKIERALQTHPLTQFQSCLVEIYAARLFASV
jgi:hypothetical protein